MPGSAGRVGSGGTAATNVASPVVNKKPSNPVNDALKAVETAAAHAKALFAKNDQCRHSSSFDAAECKQTTGIRG
jgi:hypothetical protein